MSQSCISTVTTGSVDLEEQQRLQALKMTLIGLLELHLYSLG